TSLILTFSIFVLSFLIEGKISKLVIISVFILVIVYGRFFNKSTEKIIEAYFAQRKAKIKTEIITNFEIFPSIRKERTKIEKVKIKLVIRY
ncbi:hypothetical protein KKH26_01940, partial [Patescibacteria group bacterium]|nr:hypothetical protein [Patescibacteria group bacterium]